MTCVKAVDVSLVLQMYTDSSSDSEIDLQEFAEGHMYREQKLIDMFATHHQQQTNCWNQRAPAHSYQQLAICKHYGH